MKAIADKTRRKIASLLAELHGAFVSARQSTGDSWQFVHYKCMTTPVDAPITATTTADSLAGRSSQPRQLGIQSDLRVSQAPAVGPGLPVATVDPAVAAAPASSLAPSSAQFRRSVTAASSQPGRRSADGDHSATGETNRIFKPSFVRHRVGFSNSPVQRPPAAPAGDFLRHFGGLISGDSLSNQHSAVRSSTTVVESAVIRAIQPDWNNFDSDAPLIHIMRRPPPGPFSQPR